MTKIVALVVACMFALSGCKDTTTIKPKPSPTPTSVSITYSKAIVERVIDGDTFELRNGQRVRFIGMNATEKKQELNRCATTKLEQLIDDKVIMLGKVSNQDKDRYGRMLRYVKTTDHKDVGAVMIGSGYAKAYYDSRNGYKRHPKQSEYVQLDFKSKDIC